MLYAKREITEPLSVRKLEAGHPHHYALINSAGETVGFLDRIYLAVKDTVLCRVTDLDSGYSVLSRIVVIIHDEATYVT